MPTQTRDEIDHKERAEVRASRAIRLVDDSRTGAVVEAILAVHHDLARIAEALEWANAKEVPTPLKEMPF